MQGNPPRRSSSPVLAARSLTHPRRHPELSAMPSASVRLLAARFSVTETTEGRRPLSLRPTSLAHRNSLVEAGSVPSLAPAAILAIHNPAIPVAPLHIAPLQFPA